MARSGAGDGALRGADPAVAEHLERALSGREVSARGGEALLSARGPDACLVGTVADELRRRECGGAATYVVNRNINFTNVCIKQCGFCAFSRDFRGSEEAYMLPTAEIVRRAAEARALGATEVCVQAGLPPDMDGSTYERIARGIKTGAPGLHVHAFSPEEVAYGAARSGAGVPEYLARLREAGVDTLPGTSAEILDQSVRDRISPGRITVRDWMAVVAEAHRQGIRTTSTMMFGHVESYADRARHMALLRSMQRRTGGFTEFVPLRFIADEAPMARDWAAAGAAGRRDKAGAPPGAPPGAPRGGGGGGGGGGKGGWGGAMDTLLTHAVARIMLGGAVRNIQASWVKEGPAMAQLLLAWGANDLGGTLINESISTSAGAGHGQLLRPREIRALARGAGRVPAERTTLYGSVREFGAAAEGAKAEPEGAAASAGGASALDALDDPSRFGSYFELVKIDRFRYRNARRQGAAARAAA